MVRFFYLALFLFPLFSSAQKELPYQLGEYSSFDVSFGAIKVGSADMEIVSDTIIDSTSVFHIVGKGKTAPFFDWFFKVRDVYETFLDTSELRPLRFIRDIHEGGYEKTQLYNFNHHDSLVFTEDTAYSIPLNSQDMLSALFFARTFNKEDLKKTNSFFVPIFMDEENYFLEILYLENELLQTKWGAIDCMVFKPKMQEGRVFEDGEEMKIWITDDGNHLLMKVETKIWAGSIKAVLVEYKELKFPLSINQ
jgi:hypothetical protein